MAQQITIEPIPAKSLSDTNGTGIVANRDVIVEADDLEPGAISNTTTLSHLDDVVKPPESDPDRNGNHLRTETVDISHLSVNTTLQLNVSANFDSFDTSLVGGGSHAETQVEAWLAWSLNDDFGVDDASGSIMPVKLVFDTTNNIYVPYTINGTISLPDEAPSDTWQPHTITLTFVVEKTQVGFTNTDILFEVTGVRA